MKLEEVLEEALRAHHQSVDPLGIVCSCERKFRTMTDLDRHVVRQQVAAVRACCQTDEVRQSLEEAVARNCLGVDGTDAVLAALSLRAEQP